MESKKSEDKKLWTQSEIDAKLKEFDDKIEAAKRDDNTTNVSPDTIKVDKGIFLKDKAKDWEKAEEVL